MSGAALAVGREDVASYVEAVFLVYLVLIFGSVLLSWLPRWPSDPRLAAVATFVRQTTDPYLNVFRRVLPAVGGSSFRLDLSPIVGIFVLLLLQGLVVGLIRGA